MDHKRVLERPGKNYEIAEQTIFSLREELTTSHENSRMNQMEQEETLSPYRTELESLY